MILNKGFLILTFLIFSISALFAQADSTSGISLNNFIVKENLLKNGKLAVIAADATDKPIESFNGTFIFSINGFQQELKFNEGVAIAPQVVDKSTFIYFKHENENGTHGKLYYVVKKQDSLDPYKINWLVLVLVPIIIIILATMFRKFIIIAGILLILLFVFNSSKGLKLPTFFETVIDGLKSVV